MNSQKKSIDVWIIYRCEHCDTTTNLTILSRTKPERMDKVLFRKFSANDPAIARQYAFSRELARMNKVEFDFSSIDYEIEGLIMLEELLKIPERVVSFRIKCDFDLDLKLSAVIRKGLSLSANRLARLVERKIILLPDNVPLKKRKVRNGDIIRLDLNKLMD